MNKSNYNKKNLNILMTDELSCISKIEQSITLLLHPMFSEKIEEGIKVELDSLTNKYSNEFTGFLLGYEAVKIVSNLGKVFDTFPFIHVDIIAKLFIFRPTKEAVVEGKVIKKSPHHIGCLVHGLFNVSCDMPSNIKNEEWLGSSVQEGEHLNIKIIETDIKSAVPQFKGKIDSVSSVNTQKVFIGENNNERNTSNDLSFTKRNKKNKTSKPIKEVDAEESLSEDADRPIPAKVKKSKKSIDYGIKFKSENLSEGDDTGINNLNSMNHKQKKKKKICNEDLTHFVVMQDHDFSFENNDVASKSISKCNNTNDYKLSEKIKIKKNIFQNNFSSGIKDIDIKDEPISSPFDHSFAFSTKRRLHKEKKIKVEK